MANQACLAIGIDRYQHIQPLGYGAADAKAVADFFVEQAGWGDAQCLLLSDRAPARDLLSAQPTQENITEWIDRWCWEKLKPNDLVWVFFSGHGICYQNEDYLVPIDGDLDRIPETCIPARDIYQKLNDIGVNAIVCLDINRTQGASFCNQVGKKIGTLALEYKIPTFFSCQNHEFSHEAASLGHGLFTVALLEALNYNFDLNLETLEAYLKERLQNLSNHHWKPVQTPIAVFPGNISASRPIFTATTQGNLQDRDRERDRAQRIPQPPLPRKEPDLYADPTPSGILISPEAGQGGILVKMDRHSGSAPKPRAWPRWLSISGLVAGLAAAGTGAWFAIQSIAGSGVDPQPALPPAQTQSNANPPNDGTADSSAIVPATSTQMATATSAGNLPTLARARAEIIGRDATSRYKAILTAQKIPPTSEDYTNAQSAIEEWSQEIYKIAQSYAEKGETKKAIGTARMVPQSTKIYDDVRAKMSEWGRQNP